MQVKNQMGSYIGNFDGNQKEALLRFLFASMLYADTDLSECCLTYDMHQTSPRPDDEAALDVVREAEQALLHAKEHRHISINPESGLPAADHTAAIRGFWRVLLGVLRGVADFDATFNAIDLDGSGDISLDELRTAMKRCEPLTTEAEVRERFDYMDADHDGMVSRQEFLSSPQRGDLEMGAGGKDRELVKLAKLNSHIFLDTQAGLLKRMVRCSASHGGRDVSLQVAEGVVPCSLVAMHIVIDSSDVSKTTGDPSGFRRATLLLAAIGMSMGFLGPIIRTVKGQPAYGTSPIEKLFYASKTLPECFFGMLLMAFPLNGCFWLFRQLLMAQRLLDLIEPQRVFDVRWRSHETREEHKRAEAGKSSLPRLDLSNPTNVQGWAALRRVVYGRNFAPAVELKMQFYITITLFLFLVSSAANTLGSLSGSQSASLPTDFVIVSVLRPAFLSVPIILQVCVCVCVFVCVCVCVTV